MKLLRWILCCMLICCTCIILLPSRSAAELRTISWTAVTTYTDNTLIPTYETIVYDIYWHTTTDFLYPGIHTIVIGETTTAHQFDVTAEGLPRSTTVYFTGKARQISNGATSEFAPAYTWTVPPVPIPGTPTLNSTSLHK